MNVKLNILLVLSCCMLQAKKYKSDFLPFDKAMYPHSFYKPARAIKEKRWRILKELYTQNLITDVQYQKRPRIPKIIHQIWLGSPLPEECMRLRETWMKLHPRWTFVLWTEKEIDEFGLKNRVAFDAATNYGEKSDIARYEILHEYGGLYIDTDFECLNPIDVFHHCCDFYVCIAFSNDPCVVNGLIGTVPGHPIMRECIENIENTTDRPDSTMGIIHRTGPRYITKCFFNKLSECTGPTVALPMIYFFPFPHFNLSNKREWDLMDNQDIRNWIKPESFAIHYYFRSWFLKK